MRYTAALMLGAPPSAGAAGGDGGVLTSGRVVMEAAEPQEYGSGSKSSTEGDVYSYGVLLLEIFTARRPTDNFMDGVTSLVGYVRMAYPDKLLEILDASATYRGNSQHIIDIFVYPMFKLALACCKDSPRHRMKIDDVVKELNIIKRACAAHKSVHEFRATA